ncbi:hypothetical protein A2U01_0056377, partial [Trifolium medium]|nr:hypothetical protein [Trifolium medium]
FFSGKTGNAPLKRQNVAPKKPSQVHFPVKRKLYPLRTSYKQPITPVERRRPVAAFEDGNLPLPNDDDPPHDTGNNGWIEVAL